MGPVPRQAGEACRWRRRCDHPHPGVGKIARREASQWERAQSAHSDAEGSEREGWAVGHIGRSTLAEGAIARAWVEPGTRCTAAVGIVAPRSERQEGARISSNEFPGSVVWTADLVQVSSGLQTPDRLFRILLSDSWRVGWVAMGRVTTNRARVPNGKHRNANDRTATRPGAEQSDWDGAQSDGAQERRGAEQRSAERRGAERRDTPGPVRRGWGAVGPLALGTSAVRPVLAPSGARDASEAVAQRGTHPREARRKGTRRNATRRHRRGGTRPRGLGRTAHAPDSEAHHSERSHPWDSTRWDHKLREADPSHRSVGSIAPVAASVGPVPPVCHPAQCDPPQAWLHLARWGCIPAEGQEAGRRLPGVAPAPARSCSELPGVARSCPELPGVARSCPELPGVARSRPEVPANARQCPANAPRCPRPPLSALHRDLGEVVRTGGRPRPRARRFSLTCFNLL